MRKLVILVLLLAVPLANMAYAAHWCASGDTAVSDVAGKSSLPVSGHSGHCDLCVHVSVPSIAPVLTLVPITAWQALHGWMFDSTAVATSIAERIDKPPR